MRLWSPCCNCCFDVQVAGLVTSKASSAPRTAGVCPKATAVIMWSTAPVPKTNQVLTVPVKKYIFVLIYFLCKMVESMFFVHCVPCIHMCTLLRCSPKFINSYISHRNTSPTPSPLCSCRLRLFSVVKRRRLLLRPAPYTSRPSLPSTLDQPRVLPRIRWPGKQCIYCVIESLLLLHVLKYKTRVNVHHAVLVALSLVYRLVVDLPACQSEEKVCYNSTTNSYVCFDFETQCPGQRMRLLTACTADSFCDSVYYCVLLVHIPLQLRVCVCRQ